MSLLERESARDSLQHHKLAYSTEFHRVSMAVKSLKVEKIVSFERLCTCPEFEAGATLPDWFVRRSFESALEHLQAMVRPVMSAYVHV